MQIKPLNVEMFIQSGQRARAKSKKLLLVHVENLERGNRYGASFNRWHDHSGIIRLCGEYFLNLQEHIELYRRIRMPFKRQFLTLALELARQHYNQELELLVDTGKGQKTMTLKEFIEACMTPLTPESPVVQPVAPQKPRQRAKPRARK